MSDLLNLAKELSAREFGYNWASLGVAYLTCSLQKRMLLTSLTESNYFALLSTDLFEQRAFLQLLLVSESWFLREVDPVIEALSILRRRGTPISVLSVPCARGEEPISVLDCARRVGFNYSEITVHGYDASAEAIAQARTFSFSEYSFRGTDNSFRFELFEADGRVFSLKPALRSHLWFESANILDATWIPRFGQYDLILCRNLFIYLTPTSQDQLIAKLAKFISPGGFLIVGATEAVCIKTAALEISAISPLAFTPVKKAQKATERLPSIVASKAMIGRVNNKSKHIKKIPKPADIKDDRQEVSNSISRPAPEVVYEEILKLANKGDLDMAFTSALERLERHPKDAKTLYLLGIIVGSCGKLEEASYWMQRALEYDPKHEEAGLYIESLASRRNL